MIVELLRGNGHGEQPPDHAQAVSAAEIETRTAQRVRDLLGRPTS
ncbi:hypothetical protein [Nakamurella panacisegetis]|nr:hypothetical protein [Nakamurella panacisegetis]